MAGMWYAASVIVYFFRRDVSEPDEFLVWENVLLIDAASADEALSKAERYGRAEAVSDESLTWNGHPVSTQFGGVRKVLSCSLPVTSSQEAAFKIEDGTEATFSTFVVEGRENLERLIHGKAVDVTYDEE